MKLVFKSMYELVRAGLLLTLWIPIIFTMVLWSALFSWNIETIIKKATGRSLISRFARKMRGWVGIELKRMRGFKTSLTSHIDDMEKEL